MDSLNVIFSEFDPSAIIVENITTEGASNSITVSWVIPENSCDVIGYQIYSVPADGTEAQTSSKRLRIC